MKVNTKQFLYQLLIKQFLDKDVEENAPEEWRNWRFKYLYSLSLKELIALYVAEFGENEFTSMEFRNLGISFNDNNYTSSVTLYFKWLIKNQYRNGTGSFFISASLAQAKAFARSYSLINQPNGWVFFWAWYKYWCNILFQCCFIVLIPILVRILLRSGIANIEGDEVDCNE